MPDRRTRWSSQAVVSLPSTETTAIRRERSHRPRAVTDDDRHLAAPSPQRRELDRASFHSERAGTCSCARVAPVRLTRAGFRREPDPNRLGRGLLLLALPLSSRLDPLRFNAMNGERGAVPLAHRPRRRHLAVQLEHRALADPSGSPSTPMTAAGTASG
jgi:hypothetical protein